MRPIDVKILTAIDPFGLVIRQTRPRRPQPDLPSLYWRAP